MPPIPHELAMGNKIDMTVAGAVIYSCGEFYTPTLRWKLRCECVVIKGIKPDCDTL